MFVPFTETLPAISRMTLVCFFPSAEMPASVFPRKDSAPFLLVKDLVSGFWAYPEEAAPPIRTACTAMASFSSALGK